MSKRKSPDYRQKRAWLAERFAEGLKIQIVHETGRRDVGFVEHISGEFAWRAVLAPGYLEIHCLWVVGKGKGKGHGSRLVQVCLDDARAQNRHGVVVVSSDHPWLASKGIFLQNGFVEIDQAPPSFQLLVHRFGSGPEPSFPDDWEARQAHFGPGLTVVRAHQCPYLEAAEKAVLEIAAVRGIPARVVELCSSRAVQTQAPSARGVYGLVLDGEMVTAHSLQAKDVETQPDANPHRRSGD